MEKMREARTIIFAAESRRDLCYAPDNEAFCFYVAAPSLQGKVVKGEVSRGKTPPMSGCRFQVKLQISMERSLKRFVSEFSTEIFRDPLEVVGACSP